MLNTAEILGFFLSSFLGLAAQRLQTKYGKVGAVCALLILCNQFARRLSKRPQLGKQWVDNNQASLNAKTCCDDNEMKIGMLMNCERYQLPRNLICENNRKYQVYTETVTQKSLIRVLREKRTR